MPPFYQIVQDIHEGSSAYGIIVILKESKLMTFIFYSHFRCTTWNGLNYYRWNYYWQENSFAYMRCWEALFHYAEVYKNLRMLVTQIILHDYLNMCCEVYFKCVHIQLFYNYPSFLHTQTLYFIVRSLSNLNLFASYVISR